MRRSLVPSLLLLAAACRTAAPVPAAPPAQASPAPAARPAPLPPGLDASALDTSVDPCADFYQYACGGWLKAQEIPAERSRWSRGFDFIQEKNLAVLREILDASAAGKAPDGTPYARALGDYYGACMDEPRLEQSLPELQAELSKLTAVTNPRSLALALAHLHARGVFAAFSIESVQDYKDATQVIGEVDQDGLGMPDRDYYLKDDEKTKAIRDAYARHVENVFGLLGQPPAQARASAGMVMEVETRLARAFLPKVDRRAPEKMYHRLERKGLARLAPQFPWDDYFRAVGAPESQALNVTHPPFFEEVGAMVKTVEPRAWHAYLTWHLVHGSERALPRRFQDEAFTFEKALNGTAQDLPRWKQCVQLTDRALGEALAVPFIARTFGADGKARTREMVAEIEAAFERNLDSLDWMDAQTKARALEKVRRITNKIGYPDRWREYDRLKVDRQSFLVSLGNARAFAVARQLAKIGKPLDRVEWDMTPPTVNAYYESSRNEIVFPAGILQPPFFNREATDAVNFGAMGMVVGHEITHGFDDEGRQYDGDGNLQMWWSDSSNKLFLEKAGCVKQQFDGYTAIDDLKINGALTLGENVADLGGLKLSYAAMKAWLEKHPAGTTGDRYTPGQQFFLGFAQAWCSKVRPERARVLVRVDPHSPAFLRINGPLRNLPAFREAFNCPAGSPMTRPAAEACQVW